ncbi:MAG: hypothetical protein ACLFU6_11580, partial [Candidatus Hydrogenedentota bacterium]
MFAECRQGRQVCDGMRATPPEMTPPYRPPLGAAEPLYTWLLRPLPGSVLEAFDPGVSPSSLTRLGLNPWLASVTPSGS